MGLYGFFFIQSIEPSIRKLEKQTISTFRYTNVKPQKTNVTRLAYQAINCLRNDTSIHILKADKGNATVVKDHSEYDQKVKDILDTDTYTDT